MRCNICDRALSDTEIIWNKDIKTYEPCNTCLEIAMDAAYSQGFKCDGDPLDDPEMQEEFGNGAIETIDPDFQRDEYGDLRDIHYFGGMESDYD